MMFPMFGDFYRTIHTWNMHRKGCEDFTRMVTISLRKKADGKQWHSNKNLCGTWRKRGVGWGVWGIINAYMIFLWVKNTFLIRYVWNFCYEPGRVKASAYLATRVMAEIVQSTNVRGLCLRTQEYNWNVTTPLAQQLIFEELHIWRMHHLEWFSNICSWYDIFLYGYIIECTRWKYVFKFVNMCLGLVACQLKFDMLHIYTYFEANAFNINIVAVVSLAIWAHATPLGMYYISLLCIIHMDAFVVCYAPSFSKPLLLRER